MRKVYTDCKLYGPYKSKQDGRLRCIVVDSITKKKTTISYPKYLVEIELNRCLDKEETIDHIDGNFLNNDLSNLRVINRSFHIKEDIKTLVDLEQKDFDKATERYEIIKSLLDKKDKTAADVLKVAKKHKKGIDT